MITGQNPQRSRWLHHLVLAGLASTLVVVSLAFAPPRASQAAQTSAGRELKRGACPECPVTLLEANLKAEEPAGPTIQVRNDANHPVKYFYLVLENRTTNQKAYFRVSETLEPGETKTVAVHSQRAMVPIEEAPNRYRLETVGAAEARQRVGDLAQVETKVPTVVFADNSSFALKGYLPAPPPPPPVPAAPPAPPAPPAPSDREAPRALPTVPAPPTPPPAPPVPPETDEQYMGGVVGGVPGGVKGGVVGGVVGGVPGGVKGGVAGGVVGGVPAPAKKRARKPNPAPVPKPAVAPESKSAPAPAPAPKE